METLTTRTYQIRPVRREDLSSIYRLEESSFKDAFPNYFISQLAEANPSTFLVAVESGQVVGYAVVENWTDHQHLVSIAVSQESRKKGIGQALLNEMMSRLREGPLRLELRRGNTAALALYKKNGFSETGIAESYYTDGEDALQMEKQIRARPRIMAPA